MSYRRIAIDANSANLRGCRTREHEKFFPGTSLVLGKLLDRASGVLILQSPWLARKQVKNAASAPNGLANAATTESVVTFVMARARTASVCVLDAPLQGLRVIRRACARTDDSRAALFPLN